MIRFAVHLAVLAAMTWPAAVHAQADDQELAKAILTTMIETNTTGSVGDTAVLAQALAKRFVEAGLPERTCRSSGRRRATRISSSAIGAPARASRCC
jgi:hypothetical protein